MASSFSSALSFSTPSCGNCQGLWPQRTPETTMGGNKRSRKFSFSLITSDREKTLLGCSGLQRMSIQSSIGLFYTLLEWLEISTLNWIYFFLQPRN